MVDLQSARHIHLIGVGGCSMSGLARILKAHGHEVTGSDRERTQFTESLDEAGIPYTVGHTGALLEGADAVIYSAAIRPDNPERVLAAERGIPQLERSEALGQLSERFSQVVAVAGCHGKTTITSMLALIADAADADATVHVGGYVDALRGGVRVGGRGLFITEACEYVESFLTLSPTIALISNIDNDHLDYFHDMAHIEAAFEKFLARLPQDGVFVACTDDARVRALYEASARRAVSYGLAGGDYTAADIAYDGQGCPAFTAVRHGAALGRVQLAVPGAHNVANALGALAVAGLLDIPFETAAGALAHFQNTRRRFEYYGERGGIRVYHDYGHHPSEIRATLEAASRVPHGRLYCVFQCNSYTRAHTLFTGEVTCFAAADAVLVPDIYPGREKDTGLVHARDMVAAINASGTEALYLPTFPDIRAWLDANGRPGDLVVTVGSGDVYRQTRTLL